MEKQCNKDLIVVENVLDEIILSKFEVLHNKNLKIGKALAREKARYRGETLGIF